MANGDLPRVTVVVTSHAGVVEVTIPCKDAEQSDFLGGLVVDLVNAVKSAYAPPPPPETQAVAEVA